MSRVDAYLDALDGALRSVGDFRPWPFRIEEVGPYFTDVEAVDLHARLRQLSADGISDVELGRLFPGANSIKTLLMDLVCGMKKAGIPARERVWLTERMFDAMAALETGDIFCRDGTHRLLRSEQAQELFESSTWRWVDGAD